MKWWLVTFRLWRCFYEGWLPSVLIIILALLNQIERVLLEKEVIVWLRLLLNCTLLSIAKHFKALLSIAKHQTLQLVVSQCLNILQGGGVYSVHSKEPLSMSSQWHDMFLPLQQHTLSICVSSRAPAVMSQLSEHPCSRPRPPYPRHLIFSLDILHQNIVTALQHYKRNYPFINNQGNRNSHLMWNVWVRSKGPLCEHVRCHLFASERPLSG